MGQAKQRGTFDQRQSAAFEMIDRNYEAAKVAMEKIEKETEAGKQLAKIIVEDTLDRFTRSGHPLLTADYSQLEESMLSRGYKFNDAY